MIICHTADFHIGSPLKSLDLESRALRKKEIKMSFINMCCQAKLIKAKVIIIAGDLFDSEHITKSDFLDVVNEIKLNNDIDFIYTAGNHEAQAFIDMLDEIPLNLKLFGNDYISYEYDDISITGINFNDVTEPFLYDTLRLNSDKRNILVLHGDAVFSNTKGKINLNKLKDKNIDYLALGHIHMNQINKLDDRGIYVYPGCPEGRGFDEEGIKGFYAIDTNDLFNPTFIPLSKRIVHVVNIDLSKYDNSNDFERDTINTLSKISNNDLVELVLNGTYSLDFHKSEMLYERFKDKFFLFKIKDESKLKINNEDIIDEMSIKSSFIKLASELDLSDEDKNKIIEYGITALTGGNL